MKSRTAVVATRMTDEMIETTLPLLERLEQITREDLRKMEVDVTRQITLAAIDESRPAVRITHAGGTLLAHPLDTRRLVRAMAPHLSCN